MRVHGETNQPMTLDELRRNVLEQARSMPQHFERPDDDWATVLMSVEPAGGGNATLLNVPREAVRDAGISAAQIQGGHVCAGARRLGGPDD